MLALELETVRDVSLAVLAGSVVVAVALTWVIKAVVSKLLTLALLAGFGAIVFWQRADVQSCADQVVSTLSDGAIDTSCNFFGREVTIIG